MSANLRYWTGQTCASTHLTRQIPSDFLIVDILPHLSIVFRLALYVTKPGGPLLPIDDSSNIFTYIYIYNAANCCILRLHLRWIWPQSWKSSNLVYGRAESWKHAELRNCQKQSKSLFAPLLYIVEWFWAQKASYNECLKLLLQIENAYLCYIFTHLRRKVRDLYPINMGKFWSAGASKDKTKQRSNDYEGLWYSKLSIISSYGERTVRCVIV